MNETFTQAKFDFGTADSAVENGYTKVTPQTAYDPAVGYGWLNDPRITVTAGDSGNAKRPEVRLGHRQHRAGWRGHHRPRKC